MKTSLHSVDPSETVGEAVAVMAQHRIGSVLALPDDPPLRILTGGATGRAPAPGPHGPRPASGRNRVIRALPAGSPSTVARRTRRSPAANWFALRFSRV